MGSCSSDQEISNLKKPTTKKQVPREEQPAPMAQGLPPTVAEALPPLAPTPTLLDHPIILALAFLRELFEQLWVSVWKQLKWLRKSVHNHYSECLRKTSPSNMGGSIGKEAQAPLPIIQNLSAKPRMESLQVAPKDSRVALVKTRPTRTRKRLRKPTGLVTKQSIFCQQYGNSSPAG